LYIKSENSVQLEQKARRSVESVHELVDCVQKRAEFVLPCQVGRQACAGVEKDRSQFEKRAESLRAFCTLF
jgi:hypothetical protein